MYRGRQAAECAPLTRLNFTMNAKRHYVLRTITIENGHTSKLYKYTRPRIALGRYTQLHNTRR